MRIIRYTVSETGVVSPATKQWAGVQREHNATEIVFDYTALDKVYPGAMWRIDFDSSEAGFDPGGTVFPVAYTAEIRRQIPQKFTKCGGEMTAVLVGSEVSPDGSETIRVVCSIPVTLYFAESERHEQTEGQVAESLSEMEVKVLESANKAQQNISKAEQNALDSVADIQEKLDNGDFVGPVGPQGPSGPRGDDYVLTEADKDEIAERAAEKIDVSGKQEKFAEVIENADGQTLEVLKKLLIMYESNEDFRANAYLTLDSMFAQLKANTVDLTAFSDMKLTANDLKFIAYNGIDFNDSRIQNIAAPESDSDAANKKYVDNAIPTIDQTYNPESANAQSGIAVAEAVEPFNRQYELIETITLAEAVTTITRNTEPNGKAYSFKDVFVKFSWKESTSKMWIVFEISADGKKANAFRDLFQHTAIGATAISWMRTLSCYGHRLFLFSERNTNLRYATYAAQMPIEYLDSNKPIDGIKIQYQEEMPIGTVIEIWGVRA